MILLNDIFFYYIELRFLSKISKILKIVCIGLYKCFFEFFVMNIGCFILNNDIFI